MTTHEDQLFELLTHFEMWKNDDVLDEQRLVQHELVLAHLARLYGSFHWNSQVFGLCPQYPLRLDIQAKTLSKLVAMTNTGKLMVCEQVDIPEGDNPIDNYGLFAIALPYPFPNSLQNMQPAFPSFPLYQVELKWQKWDEGIEKIVKTGEGIPLGRFQYGTWDKQYIPPVVNISANENLEKRVKELMEYVVKSKINSVYIQALKLEIQCKGYSNLTPLDFWLAHCRCLIMLQERVSSKTYQEKVSQLESEFVPWNFGSSLKKLEVCWNRVADFIDNKKEQSVFKKGEIILG